MKFVNVGGVKYRLYMTSDRGIPEVGHIYAHADLRQIRTYFIYLGFYREGFATGYVMAKVDKDKKVTFTVRKYIPHYEYFTMDLYDDYTVLMQQFEEERHKKLL